MFARARTEHGPLDEFSRPVESIMRCEDFKSNFARRLSTRYTNKSPVQGLKPDTALKLQPDDSHTEPETNVEHTKVIVEIPKAVKVSNGVEGSKTLERPSRSAEMMSTEVTAMTMEVDTLRWQLAQTEANRQMHLALLKQIVSFLNRVKEHMVCQKQEVRRESASIRLSPRHQAGELPRSRSVLHVSRNLDYSLTPAKKLATRKISKSISNVNGLKDSASWNGSKMSLVPENDAAQKITEEISRLINLANTVLSTKLPDLACTCLDTSRETKPPGSPNISASKDTSKYLDLIEEVNAKITDSSSVFSDSTFDGNSIREQDMNDFAKIDSTSSPESRVDDDFGGDVKHESDTKLLDKKDYHAPHYIEDESGFSSMSSFQDIGIPIINIVPPTPCKDIGFSVAGIGLLDRDDKWKSSSLELDQQTVQVFWV